ncbi:hypothetical protein Ccrd_010020 [Cynara cardunculus var. scolymus]|uniref:Golgin candidate 1 n=1 Tax=Cynara cardunculus var. scolymus TaxID=59895 RepID=A0A103YLW5_CYNCS|nr:hypothetical protein Ccrd_010020 [Cynara cardunculus var. scolymus]
MAHWLKAAEDLFEVVDRRAKLVVGDEQPNSQSPASNGQGSQTKRRKSKLKGQSSDRSATVDNALKKTGSRASVSKVSSDEDLSAASTDNDAINQAHSSLKNKDEEQRKVNNDVSQSDVPVSLSSLDDQPKQDTMFDKDTTSAINQEAVPPIFNSDIVNATSSKSSEEILSTSVTLVESEAEKNHPTDSGEDVLLKDKGSDMVIKKEGSQSSNSDTPSKVDSLKVSNLKIETQLDENKDQEHKPVASPKKVQEQPGSPKKVQDQPGSQKKVQDQPGSPREVQDQPSKKVQDQLDEAQGLLESSKTTGQSKEARLARVCAGLSSRLQEYKSENAQLEELLVAERDLSKSYEARIQQLQKDLSLSKDEVNRVESNMLEALAAKNAEIEALVNSMETVKKQAALSEGNLASLQANMESIMRSRELTETRMMQALKEELASAERRAEEEHAAHNATKMAAMEREVELEHRALDASTALAKIQRTADERTSKVVELEQKVALLEVECSSLTQELQDMEARARRGQKKSPEDANQVIQMQAWQEEVERARQGQRDAERKLSSLEASYTWSGHHPTTSTTLYCFCFTSGAEVQKMRVEMAAMKRDAEHYSRQVKKYEPLGLAFILPAEPGHREMSNSNVFFALISDTATEQEHMELEKRYRELTDLLYYKQTQLEAMTSEKAAAEFQLEKEMKRIQEAQVEVERSRVPRRASTTWEEDTDMKALEYASPLSSPPFGWGKYTGNLVSLLYQLFCFFAAAVINSSKFLVLMQLQKAAKILDSGAVRGIRFLWRYPVARLILLFYMVFVHLFMMYLLHRLQEQADSLSSREVAESMGLGNHTLP